MKKDISQMFKNIIATYWETWYASKSPEYIAEQQPFLEWQCPYRHKIEVLSECQPIMWENDKHAYCVFGIPIRWVHYETGDCLELRHTGLGGVVVSNFETDYIPQPPRDLTSEYVPLPKTGKIDYKHSIKRC